MSVGMFVCACKCVCTQVFTGLYVQNGERQTGCMLEAAGVHVNKSEQQEPLFNPNGQMGSGKFSQTLC